MRNEKEIPAVPNKIIQVNEGIVKEQLSEIVRETVEETLNKLLDEEAAQLCAAQKYEHTHKRQSTRAGYYERGLETTSGKVKLKVPRLRTVPFESAIIERYKRRECSVEEALIEMYLAGVSVRRIEDITEALWGTKVSPGTISNLNKQVYEKIDEWRSRPLEGKYPYVYLDGIVLKRSWADEIKNVSVLVAFGVSEDGYREILGACEGPKEDKEGWGSFLADLKTRGLTGVKLFISDKCLGLVDSLASYYPESGWQRCTVHFYRNVWAKVPHTKIKEVVAMLKAVHAQEDREAALEKSKLVSAKLRLLKLTEAAKIFEEGIAETLTYMNYPREHWSHLRTNNPMERVMKEIRRRTNVVGSFPDGYSALMLVCSRLRYITTHSWGVRRYMNMDLLDESAQENLQVDIA